MFPFEKGVGYRLTTFKIQWDMGCYTSTSSDVGEDQVGSITTDYVALFGQTLLGEVRRTER